MIGKDVSASDEHWSNFLVLLEILDYVFAPTLTHEAVAYFVKVVVTFFIFGDYYPPNKASPTVKHFLSSLMKS